MATTTNAPMGYQMRSLGNVAVALSFLLCLMAQLEVAGQTDSSRAEAIARARRISTEIDQYVESHPDSYLMLIGRMLFERQGQENWEWKTITTREEAESFTEEFEGRYQQVWVWLRNERLVFVKIQEWNSTGDWFFYPRYYFDDQGLIVQISSDFRTIVDDLKVLVYECFDDKGRTIDKAVEYYALRTEGRLPGKPERMSKRISDPQRYLIVSDLPFWKLISVLSKR
jgi:hypothetical protein